MSGRLLALMGIFAALEGRGKRWNSAFENNP